MRYAVRLGDRAVLRRFTTLRLDDYESQK
jgi:hypothetical protein